MRSCDECQKPMMEGYLIEDGYYYCTEVCLHKNMTQEEYLELYNEGEGDSYWTEWEEMTCDCCGKEEAKGFIANNSFYCSGTCLSESETKEVCDAAEFKILKEMVNTLERADI